MKMTRRMALRIAAVAVAAFPLTGCSYNTFVSQEVAIKAQWAQVENQLQRRNDLIPNLVETTKGFAQHEEGVYKDIADARSRLLAAKSPEETIAAANQQTSALGRLLAVVENYPQLKANEQFNRLMDELVPPPVPGESDGQIVWLQGISILPGAAGGQDRAEGQFQQAVRNLEPRTSNPEP
jgi:LemA protein